MNALKYTIQTLQEFIVCTTVLLSTQTFESFFPGIIRVTKGWIDTKHARVNTREKLDANALDVCIQQIPSVDGVYNAYDGEYNIGIDIEHRAYPHQLSISMVPR